MTNHHGHDLWRLLSAPGRVWCRTCRVTFASVNDTAQHLATNDQAAWLGLRASVGLLLDNACLSSTVLHDPTDAIFLRADRGDRF